MKKAGIILSNKAFSLIEVVYAVFIFAYVIVGVFGLLSIALMSVRSTINETIVNNFQCSIAGLWDVAPRHFRTSTDTTNQIGIPNIGKILLYGDKVFYLTNEGTITTNTSKAAIKVEYKTTRGGGLVMLETKYSWPPEAPDDSLVKRNIHMITAFAE